MKFLQNTILLLVMIAIITSCVASGQGAAKEGTQYNELVDYLRRTPGLQIIGSSPDYKIRVRGDVSVNANAEPLFVIDNVRVGNYSQAASMVDPNNIKYVNVLKSVADTQAYGTQGVGGVILIRTGIRN